MAKFKNFGRFFLCFFAFLAFAFPTAAAVDVDGVVVGGETFGVKISADGVIVVDFRDLETENSGKINPAYLAGIRSGDIIKEVNGEKIKSSTEFREVVAKGEKLELTVENGSGQKKIEVIPEKDTSDGTYHIGVVVKDSTAGLGTITFYDAKSGTFGALGHGICEGETSTLFPVADGKVYHTSIYSVQKGAVGTPGELRGLFLDDRQIGNLLSNTLYGAFGTITDIPDKGTVKIADGSEIREGKVTVISTVDENGPCEYEAEISRIDVSEKTDKNFVVKITDEKLLEKTGGIVQGMSGSPILQNGKLIGAVTHVCVNL